MSSLHPVGDRLLQVALDALWAAWTAIGVAGVRPSRTIVVDPEALVVATAEFGRWDPRLFDEMLDWLVTNAATVDLARLKRLAARERVAVRHIVAATAEHVAERENRRPWRALVDMPDVAVSTTGRSAPDALFLPRGETPGNAETWGDTDRVFLAHGFVRNPPELRGMSQKPDTAFPACVRFRARALTGVGARAEVLAYLWTHEWAHGRLIAERAVYAKSVVALYLTDLSVSKLASRRDDGNRVLYRLEPLLAAVGQSPVRYVEWAAVWHGVAAVWRELQEWRANTDLDHGRLSRLASTLVEAAPDLAGEGFDFHVPELRGWAAAAEGDLPVSVADRLTDRLAAFVE
jgi:hypothetical protein